MVVFRLSGSLKISNKNLTLFQVLKVFGIDFARFCYHESLPVAGNCRACLIELAHFEKPVVACAADLEVNQSIWPESLFAQKCKENIFESLLANHPLDCPICDQAGECDLQDQAKVFGGDRSRYFLNKRGVFDKNCDFLVKAIMTRCIHCARCVRFNTSLQTSKLGMLLRGTASSVENSPSKNKWNITQLIFSLIPIQGADSSLIFAVLCCFFLSWGISKLKNKNKFLIPYTLSGYVFFFCSYLLLKTSNINMLDLLWLWKFQLLIYVFALIHEMQVQCPQEFLIFRITAERKLNQLTFQINKLYSQIVEFFKKRKK